MPLYTLLLDESGQIEYPKLDPQEPIPIVGEVALADDAMDDMEKEIRKLKSTY
jgi:hypothetical protein